MDKRTDPQWSKTGSAELRPSQTHINSDIKTGHFLSLDPSFGVKPAKEMGCVWGLQGGR